jgi:hypothetical protein
MEFNLIDQMAADAAEAAAQAPSSVEGNLQQREVPASLEQALSKIGQDLVNAPADGRVRSIAELAQEQVDAAAAVDAIEELLKTAKERLRQVREMDLPAAMEAAGTSAFTMTDGSQVTVKEEVYAGISADNKDKAFEWLRATDNDGIIKNDVALSFGKGQDEDASALKKILGEFGYSYETKQYVHPQTLKAFVKTQIEGGLPIPWDTFSVHVQKVAKVVLPKKK